MAAPPKAQPAPALAREAIAPAERGWLARWLGPDRMPKVMARFPRAAGAVLLLLGLLATFDLYRTYMNGGWYSVRVLLATPAFIALGGYLMVRGRPVDPEGYASDEWNRGYMATAIGGVLLGVVLQIAFL